MTAKPTPGSPEAIAHGCRCPIIDNGRGRGFGPPPPAGPWFVMVEDCPLHGVEVLRGDDER